VLLDAQRERLAAEDTQAQAEVDLYRGIVAIYKALGGGWQPETVVGASMLAKNPRAPLGT
jgi:multidrug efflux system outer membrane protein